MKCYVLAFALAAIAVPASAESTTTPELAENASGSRITETSGTATGMPTPLNGDLARYYRGLSDVAILPDKNSKATPKAHGNSP